MQPTLSPLLQAAADELAALGWTVVPPRPQMPVGTYVRVVGQPYQYSQGVRLHAAVPRRSRGYIAEEADKDGDVLVHLDNGNRVHLNIECLEEVTP